MELLQSIYFKKFGKNSNETRNFNLYADLMDKSLNFSEDCVLCTKIKQMAMNSSFIDEILSAQQIQNKIKMSVHY